VAIAIADLPRLRLKPDANAFFVGDRSAMMLFCVTLAMTASPDIAASQALSSVDDLARTRGGDLARKTTNHGRYHVPSQALAGAT
jgi:hypothetical protein